ncbi:lysophospholipid acyltransferase family protein [Oleiagrimonas sp.]|jgi:1-acyl-sn-glycerol-3-phosphate acyltransferase|uniref:lysophospholipid acyltransferase family protein n=1 Tax=Oleiagrimonas sp. TaxID=2010330 RepID=UPI00260375CC|nr:lysophospholipid acyltransferase family protein [Oleiagrimonas sp.]MDA3913360.1 lysophospholipid acyltransferase family protein [Oleiagrimonas sp.]
MNTSDPSTKSTPDPWRALRYFYRVPWLLLHIVVAVVLALGVFTWARQSAVNGREPLAHRLIRWWSRVLLRIFGFRVYRFGTPLPDPAMFVCNHSSWLDIELMHTQRAVCFVAKAEIARWPLVGWLAKTGGTIFHRRGSNHSLGVVMKQMVQRLHGGRSVAVFPEGGTNDGRTLRVFHARIFQAALDANVQVQPAALRFMRSGERCYDAGFQPGESFMSNFLRLLGDRPLDVEVHFLKPVPHFEAGRKRMAETARAAIAQAMDGRAEDAK